MSNCALKLYALSTCVHCRNTREFLEANHVVFDCVYVDKLEGDERTRILDVVRELNPRVSFPTMLITEDNSVIVGFRKEELIKALHL